MFFGNSTQDTRQLFFTSFEKHQQKLPLTPLEQQLVRVILDHPEYHALLSQMAPEEAGGYQPNPGDENPFLHMGLHLALRDQVGLDRPSGIKAIYDGLVSKHGDPLYVEHLMMEHLALCLWEAQRNNQLPNEAQYLQACQELL